MTNHNQSQADEKWMKYMPGVWLKEGGSVYLKGTWFISSLFFSSCLHQYTFSDSRLTCSNISLYLYSCVWLYSNSQGHQKAICFSLLQQTHLMSKGTGEKTTLCWTPWAIQPDSDKLRCDSFPLCSHPQISPPKTHLRRSFAAADKTCSPVWASTSATWGTPPRTLLRKRRSTARRAWD